MVKLIFRTEGGSSIGFSPIKKSGLALINRLGLMRYPDAAKGLCFSQAMPYLTEIQYRVSRLENFTEKNKVYC